MMATRPSVCMVVCMSLSSREQGAALGVDPWHSLDGHSISDRVLQDVTDRREQDRSTTRSPPA